MLALATILVSANSLDAALPTPDETPQHGTLAGQLLIASPGMSDPRFDQTVILVVRHSEGGAFGLVINRPMGERSLVSFLEVLGEQENAVTGSVRVFAGGPLQTEIGFVVHSTDYRRHGTLDIDGRVAVTSNREVLRDIGYSKGPKKSLVAFGYAGWGPGQLEDELGRGVWFTTPEEPTLVFDDDRQKLWERILSHRK
jgi:putative transcriptional regulator